MSRSQTFKIGTVSKLTGISTHALRIWEKRYGLAPPLRSPGGGRLYTESQVVRFRLIKSLIDQGHAISQIAHLTVKQLQGLTTVSLPEVASSLPETSPAPLIVSRVMTAVRELDLPQTDRLLGHAAVALEPRVMIEDVLVPIFEQIGERWEAGQLSIAEEHGASAVMRNQLGALMRLFAHGSDGPGTVVAATLTGEMHEFGALMAALTAAVLGWRVIYLGPNLPAEQVAVAAQLSSADVVMLSLVYRSSRAEVAAVRKALPPAIAVVAGGKAVLDTRLGVRGVTVVSSLRDLEGWLATHGKKSKP